MRTLGLIVTGVVFAMSHANAAPVRAPAWETELTTPIGITLQYLTSPRTKAGFFVQGINARGNTIGFADAFGRSLYTFDKDTVPGQSSCYGECAAQWPPAVAPAGAQPSQSWSIIERRDGVRQWAHRGQPLYACAKTPDVGEAKCNGAEEGAWHTALFLPGDGMALPPGLLVDDIAAAGGQTLTNAAGMTLYISTAVPKRGEAACATAHCESSWTAVTAPALAIPMGDFTIVTGADGSKQWAFRGKVLYSYAGDIEIGDAAGAGVAGGWTPAVVSRSFIPASAGMLRPLGHTEILTTAEGMTLYKRDASYQLVTGHGLPHSAPTIPAFGRAIGTKGCNEECLKEWRPFVAPATAVPSGFWEIATRPDGTRQWVYQGYPLYTFVRDKKPGDLTGDQIYDVYVDDSADPEIVGLVPTTSGTALYWSYVEP